MIGATAMMADGGRGHSGKIKILGIGLDGQTH